MKKIKKILGNDNHINREEEIKHSTIYKISSFFIRRAQNGQQHGTMLPPARAAVHCFFFLTNGEVSADIGECNYVLKKNECVIVPAGQVFAIKSFQKCEGFMGGFHNDFLLAGLFGNNFLKHFDFLKLWGNPKISFGNKQTVENVTRILERIFAEYSAETCDNDIIRAYLITFLAEINKVYSQTLSHKLTNAEKITNHFKELLFGDRKKKNGVAEYASMLNISPNHLNKSVKMVTGKSPSKWIDEALVSAAKILLYQTNITVGEVAAEVGIFDQSYFSRIFKKHEGLTPIEFRKLIEKC